MVSHIWLRDAVTSSSQPQVNEHIPFYNHKATIFGFVITGQIVAVIAVVLRIYARCKIQKCLGWDDLSISLAVCANMAGLVGVCLSAEYGLGKHIYALTVNQMMLIVKSYYVAFVGYTTSTALVKISLLLQFLRIFTNGPLFYTCMSLLVITGLWGTVSASMAIFPCWPIAGFWDWGMPAKCKFFSLRYPEGFAASNESHAIINMALNITILFIAVLLLLRNKDRGKKQTIGLATLLSIGALVTTCSIAKLVTMWRTHAGTYPVFDPTWFTAGIVILSCLEIQGAIVCASIPFFWPVLVKLAFGTILVVDEVRVETVERDYEKRDYGPFQGQPLERAMTQLSDLSGELGDIVETDRSASSDPMMMQHYYVDEYTAAQINPLATSHQVSVRRGSIPIQHIKALAR